MYAIIRAGGKQAKVRSGDVIEVERVKNAAETVQFQPILVIDDEGKTHSAVDALDGAIVTAKVLGEVKGDKIDIFKYKNKTGYRRHMGHRQTFTQLEITGIEMKKAEKPAKKPTTKKATATKATATKATAKKATATKAKTKQTETEAAVTTDDGPASEEE